MLALITVVAVAALAATSSSVATPAEIRAAQAEAERVLAEIAEIDRNLELAVEAYNSATLRLDEIQADIEQNERHLAIARRSHRLAQRHLAERIVALYTEGEQSTLEVILGSASLDELSTASTRSSASPRQDVRIVEQIRGARAEMRGASASSRRRERSRSRSSRSAASSASGSRASS